MDPSQPHPSAEALVAYFANTLDSDAQRAVEEHVAFCDACADRARQIRRTSEAVAQTSVHTVARAYANAHSDELIYTGRGWVARTGTATRPPVPGIHFGPWLVSETFVAQGVRLAATTQPLALAHEIPEVGTLMLQLLPAAENDWRIVMRLTGAPANASVVVGLGDATAKRLGARTVTADREQQFVVTPSELARLHVHLEWQTPARARRTAVVALPVRAEE